MLTEQEFMVFEQAHQLGIFMQTQAQADVLAHRGWTCEYLGVKENGEVIAAALVTSRKIFLGKLYEISGGPVLDYENLAVVTFFVAELKKYAKQNGGLLLRIIPNLHDAVYDDEGQLLEKINQKAIENLVKAGATYEESQAVQDNQYSKISLSFEYIKSLKDIHTPQELLKSYNKNGKYYVKKTEEFGVTYRELAYEELPEFKKFTEETAERIGFEDKNLDYYQRSYKAFGEATKFVVAELDLAKYKQKQLSIAAKLAADVEKLQAQIEQTPNNKKKINRAKELSAQHEQHLKRVKEVDELLTKNPQTIILAGAMFHIQPQEITYMFSFTNEEFKKFYAPYGIQHKMMSLAVEKGIPQYNFFGVKGVFDGSDGVLRFKQSFAGHTYRYLGIFTVPVHPLKNSFANALKTLLRRN
jgi:alanine adding enzyme